MALLRARGATRLTSSATAVFAPRTHVAAAESPATLRSSLGIGIAAALVLTLASTLGINPYQFGVGDNSITLPIMHSYMDPRLYPGDFMVGQKVYYYTLLWQALAALRAHVDVSSHTLFLSVYLVALFATLMAVYLLAIRLFRSERAGVIAVTFMLFRRPTLAGIDTVESVLNTRHVATPLVLFALLLFLERRTVWSFVLLGLGYLIHPLTVHPVLAMLIVAAMIDPARRRALAVGVAAFALLAAPILAWKLAHTPPSLHLFAADPRWLQALHLRSPHHMFPSSWGVNAAVHAMLVVGLLAVSWWFWTPVRRDDRRVLAAWVATLLVVCVAGVWFAEVTPIGAAFLLQPIRSFQFLEYLVILGVANLVVDACTRAQPVPGFFTAIVAGLALVITAPGAMRPFALFLIMLAFVAWDRFAARPLGRRGFAIAACALVALTGAWQAAERRGDWSEFSATNAQDASWLDVQSWAREHTDVRDAFIVPPGLYDEFRVRSQRTVYADWEDGGLMNSNPAFGIEWLRRMRALGYAGKGDPETKFRPLRSDEIRNIAAEMRPENPRVFFVAPRMEGSRGFPVRYLNPAYLVAEVVPPTGAR